MTSSIRRIITHLCATLVALAFCAQTQADDVVTLAAEIGITPTSMALADVTPALAEAVLVSLEGQTEMVSELSERKASADAATQSATALADRLGVDPEPGLEGQYHASIATLSSIQQEIAQLHAELFTAVTEGLSQAQIERLQLLSTNGSHQAPPAFHVTPRTNAQWHAIEIALCAEARSVRLGQDLATSHAELLANVRAEPAVIAAESTLTNELAAMLAMFSID